MDMEQPPLAPFPELDPPQKAKGSDAAIKEMLLEDLLERMTKTCEQSTQLNRRLTRALDLLQDRIDGFICAPLLVRLYRAWKGKI